MDLKEMSGCVHECEGDVQWRTVTKTTVKFDI